MKRFPTRMVSFVLPLSVCLSSQARPPTKADMVYCEQYAKLMQLGLQVERSHNPKRIREFRARVTTVPQADLYMRTQGHIAATPPWVNDITESSWDYCIGEVVNDMRGYLLGDPEAPPLNTPDNHIGTITRVPNK